MTKMLDYPEPETLAEALTLLAHYGDRAMCIAGGTDVIPRLKKKQISPEALISLNRVAGLGSIDLNGALRIGAGTTHRTIEKSALIRERFSALTDAVDVLGSVQIRNVGTIGGNICTAAPSADTAPPLLVLGAQARAVSLKGERMIPLETFFQGPGKSILTPEEIVTEFIIPTPLPCSASAYWKHQRRLALDLPILGVAVQLTLDKRTCPLPGNLNDEGSWPAIWQALAQERPVCREVKIALGVAAPVPMRARKAEALLQGQVLTPELLEEAARIASEEAQPRDSVRGEAWYRKEMVRVFVKRMVLKCVERIACGETPAVELPGKA